MAKSELSYHHEQLSQWIASALLLIQTNVPLAHTQSSERGLLTFWWFSGSNVFVCVWRVYAAVPLGYKFISCSCHHMKSLAVFSRWAFRASICVFPLPPFPLVLLLNLLETFLCDDSGTQRSCDSSISHLPCQWFLQRPRWVTWGRWAFFAPSGSTAGLHCPFEVKVVTEQSDLSQLPALSGRGSAAPVSMQASSCTSWLELSWDCQRPLHLHCPWGSCSKSGAVGDEYTNKCLCCQQVRAE